ncbi:hypothetical protein IQ03_04514 [Gemmobacter caeni]|uniref:Uncharacterized protein n=1 Tax=Gemmobacter caeni TaxID=589035 RepID=A0A2T6AP60_9RHOB|nr:hypothetical protein [Gemmobacter caeni]PTX45605.1 hypothetical protein C8N34_12135 [Gemmobacter caeni]TWI93753.1 hypothetical protein IQ03_04514 [Gemmobacter caeni]
MTDKYKDWNRVRIVTPPSADGRPVIAYGTKVLTHDGKELQGVFSVTIRPLVADAFVIAEIGLSLDGLDIEAHPLLTRDSLVRAAAACGLRLVDADGRDVSASGVQPSHDLSGKWLEGDGR